MFVYPVQINNWPDFETDVEVFCRFLKDENSFNIKFHVSENIILAEKLFPNDPVYEDSCVEWFCSFGSETYYNFEFNLIGTILAQKGKNREERNFLDPKLIAKIKVIPSMGFAPILLSHGDFRWNLTITIPFEIFGDDFDLSKLKGNFYKCGDNISPKHYLSAFPVDTATPDFHTPEFFEEL
jgi:Carbohydrate-binding family 9